MTEIKRRRVATNGIELSVLEAGEGPLVLLVHGFPESAYSWRHQLPALAAAGYHAVAPDMRGYGESDLPADITAYNQWDVSHDILGLVSALGYEQAVVIGHDWGAPTAWNCALLDPQTVRAVGALSVPFSPRGTEPPLGMLRRVFEGQFFYQLYFQTPGVAEAEFEANIEVTLRKFYYLASGLAEPSMLGGERGPNDDMLSQVSDPGHLEPWCSASDLAEYVRSFERSGFRGPLNYYRNLDLTWERFAEVPQRVEQPAMFVAGDRDGVIVMAKAALDAMPAHVPNLAVSALIEGAGHWTQQEAPEAVNRYMLEFLTGLD